MVSVNSSLLQVTSSNPPASRKKKKRRLNLLAIDGATGNSFVFFFLTKNQISTKLYKQKKLKGIAFQIHWQIIALVFLLGSLFWLIIGFYSDYIIPMTAYET